ncbi:MAG: PAS domain S-box protein [Deltaproteobacteria bacterium]|nr:PAS domain S-box protein [Deltaproteobacteria bacterium]
MKTELNRRYEDIFEFVPIGFFTFGQEGQILDVNHTGARLLGKERSDLLNQKFTKFVGDEFQDGFKHHCDKVLESGNREIYDLKLAINDQSSFWVQLESIVKPIDGVKLNGHHLITSITNITYRKQTECALMETRDDLERRVYERTAELGKINSRLQDQIAECEQAKVALRESELKYATLVEDALIGVYITQDERIEFANDKFAGIYGYSKAELIGRDSLDLVHPDDRQRVKKLRRKRIRGEKVPVEYESRGLKKNGDIIWVTRSYSRIDFRGRPAISGIVADISKRRRAEEALRKSDKELRVLSNQLLSAEEKERKRIARELHDSIGQALSAIKFSVENALRELGAAEKPMDLGSLEAVIPLTQKTIEEVRRIVKDLRPSILDDLGILATIKWFCREFQNVCSGIRIETTIDIQENDIPLYLKTTIYRIMQEALNNVSKHSKASVVSLQLQKTKTGIDLTIQDNGRGFNLQQVTGIKTSLRGFGLASMRERAEMSGGRFAVNSAIETGTTIGVVWTD